MVRLGFPFCVVLSSLAFLSFAQGEEGDSKIHWTRTKLDGVFRSEGVTVGDFNKDGKNDVAAGTVYYQAPDWKMVPIADTVPEYDPMGYSNSFATFMDDLNHDGWDDIIVVDWPGTPTWWFENSKNAPGSWKRHTITPVTNNESPQYVDLDGDRKRELLFAGVDRMAFARPSDAYEAEWGLTLFSASVPDWTGRYYHGLGAGDVNGDGRIDVVIPHGWWECPKTDAQGEWSFHPIDFGQPCAQMFVYDFDGDRDNDLLCSSAHKYGLWWIEQSADGWKVHEFDSSVSETHSMCFADVNGDGLMDFITGKRFWSHGTSEPGSDQPAVIQWYELSRKDGKPVWTPHLIDRDSGVGTQFEVVDINGDGLLDVASANKKGAHVFIQSRK
jgi:hypothetical protein